MQFEHSGKKAQPPNPKLFFLRSSLTTIPLEDEANLPLHTLSLSLSPTHTTPNYARLFVIPSTLHIQHSSPVLSPVSFSFTRQIGLAVTLTLTSIPPPQPPPPHHLPPAFC